MGARRWRDRRTILAVAGLALLTVTPAAIVAARVTNLWLIAAVTAFAAVAGSLGAIWQARAQQSVLRRDAQQYGVVDGCLVLHGRLPKVRQVDTATWLGVSPAVSAGDATTPERLPPYVPRDIDGELHRQLTGNVFVLLVGDSLAGKSRAAYEAMRAMLPRHVLVAPSTRDAIPHAIAAVTSRRRGVLWLDDIEQFVGPGGLTRAGVASVLGAGRGHRVIIGTLRAVEAERLARDRAGADDVHRQAHQQSRAALAQAYRIRVERPFTHAERARARALTGDRRIGDALAVADDYGIAEYLAAGPDLLSAWENAWSPNHDPDVPSHPRGAALVAAAVDVRSVGYRSPIPRAMVELLHHRYLDERGGERLRPETVAEAWQWATQARRVTAALLQPFGDDRIKVFDYLVDAAQRGRSPDYHVHEAVIREILSTSSAADADSIAAVVQQQGRRHLAELASRIAYEQRVRQLGRTHAETIAAYGRLASAVRDLGRHDEAEAEYRAAVADSTEALGATHPQTLLLRGELSFLLVDAGRYEQAEGELRDVRDACLDTLGPAHTHTLQVRINLALVLLATRRAAHAESELTEVISVRTRVSGPNHPDTLTARHYLAHTQAELGRVVEAVTGYREVLAARTQALGPRHPATLSTGDALALLLEPVPSFRVVLLGTRGAGKSALLASMVHHLGTDGAIDGVRLRGDALTTSAVDAAYRRLTGPGDWPPGTTATETKVFSFDVVTRHEHTEQPVLTVNLLDYAGHLLETWQPGSTDLSAEIVRADAVFVVLDGVRLRRCLRGEPAGTLYLDAFVDPLLLFMARTKVPLHFLIAKWDVLEAADGGDDNAVLARIRDLLARRAPVQDAVGDRSAPVRLIPVSAVGRGFAALDGDGTVHKRPGARPAPFNVEVPLAVLLPELFTLSQRRLMAALDDRSADTGWRSRLAARMFYLCYRAQGFARHVFHRREGWSYLGMVVEDALLDADRPQARRTLLNRLRSVVAAFEAQFPEAIILPRASDDSAPIEHR